MSVPGADSDLAAGQPDSRRGASRSEDSPCGPPPGPDAAAGSPPEQAQEVTTAKDHSEAKDAAIASFRAELDDALGDGALRREALSDERARSRQLQTRVQHLQAALSAAVAKQSGDVRRARAEELKNVAAVRAMAGTPRLPATGPGGSDTTAQDARAEELRRVAAAALASTPRLYPRESLHEPKRANTAAAAAAGAPLQVPRLSMPEEATPPAQALTDRAIRAEELKRVAAAGRASVVSSALAKQLTSGAHAADTWRPSHVYGHCYVPRSTTGTSMDSASSTEAPEDAAGEVHPCRLSEVSTTPTHEDAAPKAEADPQAMARQVEEALSQKEAELRAVVRQACEISDRHEQEVAAKSAQIAELGEALAQKEAELRRALAQKCDLSLRHGEVMATKEAEVADISARLRMTLLANAAAKESLEEEVRRNSELQAQVQALEAALEQLRAQQAEAAEEALMAKESHLREVAQQLRGAREEEEEAEAALCAQQARGQLLEVQVLDIRAALASAASAAATAAVAAAVRPPTPLAHAGPPAARAVAAPSPPQTPQARHTGGRAGAGAIAATPSPPQMSQRSGGYGGGAAAGARTARLGLEEVAALASSYTQQRLRLFAAG